MLIPNNKQNSKLFVYAGAKRFAYNWALERQQDNYKQGNKFIKDNDLRKEFTQLKKQEKYLWLNDISNNVTKQAIKDACQSYERFFKGYSKYPKFKSKKRDKPSFYQDTDKIQFTDTHVKLEGFANSKKKNRQKLNWIRLAEKDRIPFGEGIKYVNPRVSFDGLNWWVSVGIDFEYSTKTPENEGIGIDLGIKNLAICSEGNKYKNINKTSKIRKLKKKLKRKQKQVSNKYEMNKQGNKFIKTNNIRKLEQEIRLIHKKLNGVRTNYLHQVTTEIIKREPSFIVLENLNVVGMMKNKNLAKAIQEQNLYEFNRQIQYKSLWNNILFIEADRWFPSSKLCSFCGDKKDKLNLSERVYICSSCGETIDRDLNASLNLRNYGLKIIKEETLQYQ